MEKVWKILLFHFQVNIWIALLFSVLMVKLGQAGGELTGEAKIRGRLRRFLGKKWNFLRSERDRFMEGLEEHIREEEGHDKLFKNDKEEK